MSLSFTCYPFNHEIHLNLTSHYSIQLRASPLNSFNIKVLLTLHSLTSLAMTKQPPWGLLKKLIAPFFLFFLPFLLPLLQTPAKKFSKTLQQPR